MLTRPPRSRRSRPPRPGLLRLAAAAGLAASVFLAAMPNAQAEPAAVRGDEVPASPAPTQGSVPPSPPPALPPGLPGGQASPAAAMREVTLYFFSPDWRPPDLGSLAAAFTAALEAAGVPAQFQAFNRYEDFRDQVAVSKPDFLMAPSWVEAEATDRFGGELQVVAVPVRDGKATYRKALMTRGATDSVDDLARGSIAATAWSMGPGTSETVLAPFQLAGASTRVVAVPKDVDALLALHFGQVDAALVTGRDYDDFARSNPEGADAMRVVALSGDIPLPPVFRSAGATEAEASALLGALLRLPSSPDGSRALDLLGFDAFAARPAGAAAPSAASAGRPGAAPSASPAARAREGRR